MADYSFLTDSEDEKAVEDLLSQAIDLSVLEQVSKINCSSFSDSPLPSHLESRFRKLKSLPTTTTTKNSNSSPINDTIFSPKKTTKSKSGNGSGSFRSGSVKDTIFSPKKSKSENGSDSVDFDDAIFSPKKKTPMKSKFEKGSGSGSGSFRSESNFSTDSASPPRKTGCFWCSPKKSSSKKSRENRFPEIGFDWGKEDDLLSADLSSFSIKEQKKILKKAMIEEEKINREAEKIVKWAKQASARMNVSALEDDELSDNEHIK